MQVFVTSAAERDLEEPVVIALTELAIDDLGDDVIDCLLTVVAIFL